MKDVEPFKTVLSGDREALAKLPMKDLEKIFAATLTGMTVEEFSGEVKPWIETANSTLQASLHGANLPADAGGDTSLSRQRLQDLFCYRWRSGLRARLFRATAFLRNK